MSADESWPNRGARNTRTGELSGVDEAVLGQHDAFAAVKGHVVGSPAGVVINDVPCSAPTMTPVP